MFTTLTPAAVIGTATTFAAEITGVALVVIGAGFAIGITSWVISKMKRAAR